MLLLITCVCLAFFNGSVGGDRGYALRFPDKGVSDYMNIWGMRSLTQFTVCFWMKSRDTAKGTPFSYAVVDEDNELLIDNYQNFSILIHSEFRRTGVSGNDGEWHQICATWENLNGEWKFYKDGEMKNGGTGLQKGYTIKAEGSLMLGQEQDTFGGGFDAAQSFKGTLTNVNVWSHVLPESAIKEMSGCCLAGEGNVYMWLDFAHAIKGNPRLVIPPDCQCVY